MESGGGLGWRWVGGGCLAWATLVSVLSRWPAHPMEASLEDALGNPEPFLLHAREGGAGAVLDLCPLGEGPLPQDEVIVGGGVHGVEHIGVFRDL